MWKEEDIRAVNLSPAYCTTTQISGWKVQLVKAVPSHPHIGIDGFFLSTYSHGWCLNPLSRLHPARDVERQDGIFSRMFGVIFQAPVLREYLDISGVFFYDTDPRCGLCAVVQPGTLTLTRLGHVPLFWAWELWVLLLNGKELFIRALPNGSVIAGHWFILISHGEQFGWILNVTHSFFQNIRFPQVPLLLFEVGFHFRLVETVLETKGS